MDTQIEREMAFWNSQEEFIWLKDDDLREILSILRKLVGLDGTVCELCAGSGTLTEHINEYFKKYYAIDISVSLLDKLKTRIPKVDVLVGNAQEPHLLLSNESCDLVICFAGLHHLPDVSATFLNSKKILRQGGFFCAFEPNKDAWYRSILWYFKGFFKFYSEDEVFLSPLDTKNKLKNAGYVDIEIKYFSPEYLSSSHGIFVRLLLVLYRVASKVLRGRRGSSFFLIRARLPKD